MGRGLEGQNFQNLHLEAQKLREIRAQELPRSPQGSPKSSKDDPNRAQREAKGSQSPPNWGQEAPKWGQIRGEFVSQKGWCWKVGTLKKHWKNNGFLMIFIDFWGFKAWNFSKNCLVFVKNCFGSLIFTQKMHSCLKKLKKWRPKAPQEHPKRRQEGLQEARGTLAPTKATILRALVLPKGSKILGKKAFSL